MNSKVYKWCAVPLCKNTSIATPNKLFVYVPNKKIVRDKWLNLARRDPTGLVTNSSLYFCEDHFDLPNDMENYMQYHIMGSVSQVRMKPGCIPKKFACQPDRKKRTSETTERPYILKKRRMMAIEECEKQLEESSMATVVHSDFEEIAPGSSVQYNIGEVQQVISKMTDKCIQVPKTKMFRSTANETEGRLINQKTLPLKPHVDSVSTSPLKINCCVNSNPSRSSVRVLVSKREQFESDSSYTASVSQQELSPSTKSLQIGSDSNCSEIIKDYRKQVAKTLECTLKKITMNPHTYIGLPQSCYFLINLIQEQTNIPIIHILLCLKKIRLNNSFQELANDFVMDTSSACKIFFKNIPILASVIRPFIVKLDNIMTRNLPMGFRHDYNKVSCIIDCIEIEVQKPSKALNQALSWSDYKNANTIKYLVSCTPNGLVNFISLGYGGRITDTCLVESCDFINCLQPGMCVMADRKFKHAEMYLRKTGVLLVRPPSVTSGVKLSKPETKETERIPSLRIPIERVIRRLREFQMLKPHAFLNLSLVKVLDDVLIIACGLINLQDSLIK